MPGFPGDSFGLLERYLPPVPEGVSAAHIERHSAPGDLLLDPFGQSPRIAIEAARLGRRIIVVNRNPVIRFALANACKHPDEFVARRALTRLADAPTAGGTVEQTIRELYRSQCPDCGSDVEPDLVAWRDDEPFEQRFVCSHCSEDKVRPLSQTDVNLATSFGARGPGYFWALDQVSPTGDNDRRNVEHALAAYTPRALHAAFTLLTKSKGLDLDSQERRALDALLLGVLDEIDSLWPYPAMRGRPKTLNPHQSFRERNVWLALEQNVALFGAQEDVELKSLEDLLANKQSGIAIEDTSLGELSNSLAWHEIAMVITAVPRPNPVLWTLSVLWASWLWDAPIQPELKRLLRRRRYDWNWHTNALRGAFQVLQDKIPIEKAFIGLLPEAEPSFLSASILAADDFFQLESIAPQADRRSAQIRWFPGAGKPSRAKGDIGVILRAHIARGVFTALERRAEPTPRYVAHAAALQSLAHFGALQLARESHADETYAIVQRTIETELNAMGMSAADQELIWPNEAPVNSTALIERAESALVEFLAKVEGADTSRVMQAVFEALPGLLSPSLDWVLVCLQSYTRESGPGLWTLRTEDSPAARRADSQELNALLVELGSRLHFDSRVEKSGAITWLHKDEAEFVFVVCPMTALEQPMLISPPAANQRVMVIPGSRSAMIQFRLQQDARLRAAVKGQNWTFLKFRHVRRLAGEPDLNRISLLAVLGLDPIAEQPSAQIPLL